MSALARMAGKGLLYTVVACFVAWLTTFERPHRPYCRFEVRR